MFQSFEYTNIYHEAKIIDSNFVHVLDCDKYLKTFDRRLIPLAITMYYVNEKNIPNVTGMFCSINFFKSQYNISSLYDALEEQNYYVLDRYVYCETARYFYDNNFKENFHNKAIAAFDKYKALL